MLKLFLLIFSLWFLLLLLRISFTGLDPTDTESGSEVLQPFQESLDNVINQILPYPQAPLLSGILFGSQGRLSYFFRQDLKTTSTIHMVVVSGQNLTILAGFLMSLASLLGRRKTIVLTLLAIIFYSLLTGLQIPVIRAAIMAFMAYLAQLLGREKVGWWVLFLTAALMLLVNPNWIFSISFQLSFLATAGVLLVAPLVSQYLTVVPKILKEDIATTVSAQALTLPIIAYNFHQLSVVGVIANIFTLWTIPIIMVSGFITVIFGLIDTTLGQIVGLIPGVLLTYFIYVVKFFAGLPGASLKLGETNWVLWAGYYLLILSLIWVLKVRQTIKEI